MRVILARQAGTADGGWRFYARRWELPVPPYPGLGIALEAGAVPQEAEEVWVTAAGEVVVELESAGEDWRPGPGWVAAEPFREDAALAAAEARVVSEDDGEPE